jgi:hypothetical protein
VPCRGRPSVNREYSGDRRSKVDYNGDVRMTLSHS